MLGFQMSPLLVRDSNHVVIHAGSVALSFLSHVICVIVLNLAKERFVPNALFQTSSRNVSETFPLEVTMDWWSESYWIMIDAWTTAWLIYAGVGLSKRNVLGPESCNPEIHPPAFYLTWTIVNIARVCGVSLWHRHYILGAVTLGWIPPILSFSMLHVSYSNLDTHRAWLAVNSPSVISWTRYLTQNGLSVFAWWSLLNAVVRFGVVLKYKGGVPDPLASTIVLVIVSLCVITWFILQSLVLNKYLRYTFGVYAILILGLGAMFTRSYRVHGLSANTVYCGFLMLVMTIMNMIHLISACRSTEQSSRPVVVQHVIGSGRVWHLEGNITPELQK